jgi:hypothetical protein
MNIRKLVSALTLSSAFLLGAAPGLADSHGAKAAAEPATEGDPRSVAVSMEATIIEVDQESRHVTLEGPTGDVVSITVPEDVTRLKDFAVGDKIVATYMASISGELREPTKEELAEPWVELDAAAIAEADMDPGAIAGRAVQAVCTIEGMNRVTNTVMVQDPRGKYHVISDVPAEKMEGVTLGQTVILTYTEAMALVLEKKAGE